MYVRIPGPKRKTLREILLSAFDRSELKRALAESDPPRSFEQLVPEGSLSDQIFELIAISDRAGWITQLVELLEHERPDRPDLIDRATALFNTKSAPPSLADQSNSTPIVAARGSRRPFITGTVHTLPFEKLSPFDFERMCLWLVSREGYERPEHLGAAGSEQGRDIVAWKGQRRIVFQCKRVERLDSGKAAVEISKLRGLPRAEQPDELVFVVSSDVSALVRNRIRTSWGDEATCHFWAGSELDERVKRHSSILNEFFEPIQQTLF